IRGRTITEHIAFVVQTFSLHLQAQSLHYNCRCCDRRLLGDDLTMPFSLLSILSAATVPATTQAAKTPGLVEFFQSPMFVLMACVLIFYIFMMKSKKNQDTQRKSMLEQLKRGDRIQTIGGILGTVIEAKED